MRVSHESHQKHGNHRYTPVDSGATLLRVVETTEDDRRRRIARAVRERRELMGLTQEALSALSGVSTSTIRAIENWTADDRGFSAKTIRSIEEALYWRRGAFDELEDGGEPEDLLGGDVPIPGMPSVTSERTIGSSRRVFVLSGPQDRVDVAAAQVASALETKPRSAIEDALWERLVQLALAEERHVNEVLRDAIDLYERTLGPR